MFQLSSDTLTAPVPRRLAESYSLYGVIIARELRDKEKAADGIKGMPPRLCAAARLRKEN